MSFHFCGYDQSQKFTIHMLWYIYIYVWGSFPGTFGNKCLFKFWMLIGFNEDVSLMNDDWFSKTLKPTKCFFKECQKCFLLKNANARPACGPKKMTLWNYFLESTSPLILQWNCRGGSKFTKPKTSQNQCGSKTGKPYKHVYKGAIVFFSWALGWVHAETLGFLHPENQRQEPRNHPIEMQNYLNQTSIWGSSR